MISSDKNIEKVELKNAFSTPILMIMVNDSNAINKSLKKIILNREKKEPKKLSYSSNIGGWHSERDFLKWGNKSGSKIIEKAIYLANTITMDRNGRNVDIEWQINAWANINRKGNSNEFHIHPGSFLSGVYFVDDGGCAENKSFGGEFVIMDPRGSAPSMYAPSLCFRSPGGNALGATELLSPRSGVMILFPSWLSHAVRPYYGNSERISISFNLSLPREIDSEK